jgi:hypothetical protein
MVFDGCAGQGDSVRVGFTVFHAEVRFFVGDMIVVVLITVLVVVRSVAAPKPECKRGG